MIGAEFPYFACGTESAVREGAIHSSFPNDVRYCDLLSGRAGMIAGQHCLLFWACTSFNQSFLAFFHFSESNFRWDLTLQPLKFQTRQSHLHGSFDHDSVTRW
jgi:hypothetical protein